MLVQSLGFIHVVHVRTCPYQSWQNIAERVMSTLNLALQNVSLSRLSMPSEFEALICNKNTLGDVRKEIKKKPELSDAIRDAMASAMIAVGERFKSMKIKETAIKLGVPATEEGITDFFFLTQHLLTLIWILESLLKLILRSASLLKNF